MKSNSLFNQFAPGPSAERNDGEDMVGQTAGGDQSFNSLVQEEKIKEAVNIDDSRNEYIFPKLNQGLLDDSEMSLADEAGL
ncbi:hypothetical protein [Chryseosolibacter indicus]|uniref:Uncharacterized protein n=1 Tax=Chryseosolibacter indicus TaxID=2782351 RepID=A0ABS5VKE3_9BACT|nr:hypothetical protein [Chryseosolibacter indicus]MBT1701919.1 hypothetical protein [Chryseosolibacter indicus]